jgi:uncharacterized protein YigA (DUF484 family)
MNPITEQDIANYLIQRPASSSAAELLGRAADQPARRARRQPAGAPGRDAAREDQGLEQRLMELMRHGNENMLIADKLQRWARQLMLVHRAVDLPVVLVSEICAQFNVPQAALRLWDVAEAYAQEPFALGASDDVRTWPRR